MAQKQMDYKDRIATQATYESCRTGGKRRTCQEMQRWGYT